MLRVSAAAPCGNLTVCSRHDACDRVLLQQLRRPLSLSNCERDIEDFVRGALTPKDGLLHHRRSVNRRQKRAVCASSSSGIRTQISNLVTSDLYSQYLQGAVFFGVLAAVDAGYSGDWSRIGAISKETEDWLRQVLPLLGGFHIFCAAISGITASRAGRPWQWPVVKASLVGGLAMFEQLLRLDGGNDTLV